MGKFQEMVDQDLIRRSEASATRERVYLEKIANAIVFDLPRISPWLTATCPECGVDIDQMSYRERDDHTITAGAVLVGCEDYWVINPAVLFDASDPDGQVDTWVEWRTPLCSHDTSLDG
jgi:hypothetical protein